MTVTVPAGEPDAVETTVPLTVRLPPGLTGLGLGVTVMLGGAPVTPSVIEGSVDGPEKPAPGRYTKVTLATPTYAQRTSTGPAGRLS